MVSANGDGAYKRQSSNVNGDVLDYSAAREVLGQDYARRDGLSAEDLLDSTRHGGLAYNDFLVLPGYIGRPAMRANGMERLRSLWLTLATGFPASDVNLDTQITRRISLKTPLISSPMDTVTEHSMAIHMALLGGLGVVHHNCSAEDQAEMVRKVKRYENGFILDPVVISANTTVGEAKQLKEKWGFGGFPVTGESTKRIELPGESFNDVQPFYLITFVQPKWSNDLGEYHGDFYLRLYSPFESRVVNEGATED